MLTAHLQKLPVWRFNGALIVMLLMASVNAIRLAFDVGYYYHAFNCDETAGRFCAFTFPDMYVMAITVGFLICSCGLWLKRAVGFILSLLGFLFVGINYIGWYQSTLAVMQNNGVHDFSQVLFQKQHLVPLANDATSWDLAVLLVTIMLFCWQFKIIVDVARVPHRRKSLLKMISSV